MAYIHSIEQLIARADRNNSVTVITETSDVSFSIPINVFPAGGMATRMACGKIIRHIVCAGVIPDAYAASYCPLEIDNKAPRKHLGQIGPNANT